MPAEIPVPMAPSPPPYQEVQAKRPRNQDHLEILLQEQHLTRELLQIHCTQVHPEGYTVRSTLLKLAGRYRVI
jgi:hypothetical protein